jgi:predicted acyl esterase
VKNIPETNGKVGIIGISYDGFLPLMALVNPHPALKVSVPMNPMVDGWMGDDWFHHGAFRQINMSYMLEQVVTRATAPSGSLEHYDDYDMYMRAGSAGELARQRGLEQSGFWRKVAGAPGLRRLLAAAGDGQDPGGRQPLSVPVMLVHSLWDAEDIYGPVAVYKALKPNDTTTRSTCRWVRGRTAARSATAAAWARCIFRQRHRPALAPGSAAPFLAALPEGRCAAADSHRDGVRDRHQQVAQSGRLAEPAARRLHDQPAAAPVPARRRARRRGRCKGFDEYVSDPAKPVPFRQRPIPPYGYDEEKGQSWPRWLTDDQRDASGRTDVADLRVGRAHGAGEDQRRAGGEPAGLDQRHRQPTGS